MQGKITVYEFCLKYLEPLQQVTVSDFDDEHIYYQGKVVDIINETSTAFQVMVKRVSPRYELDKKMSIELEV